MAASSTATGYADRLSSGAYFGDVNLRPEPDQPAVATGKVAALAAAVRAAGGRVVVHTGAGLSTAAGIRDFRSTDGVWTAAAADKARRLQEGKAGVDSPRESWSPLSDRDGADSGGDGACGGGDRVYDGGTRVDGRGSGGSLEAAPSLAPGSPSTTPKRRSARTAAAVAAAAAAATAASLASPPTKRLRSHIKREGTGAAGGAAGAATSPAPDECTAPLAAAPQPADGVSFLSAAPTLAHMALVGLVAAGLVSHVVSQNVDGLHLRSGLPRGRLSELHGDVFVESCASCGAEYYRPFTEMPTVGFCETGRRCTAPAASPVDGGGSGGGGVDGAGGHGGKEGVCGGPLHDQVLDWDDPLPETDSQAADAASDAAALALVVGSSMQMTAARGFALRTIRPRRVGADADAGGAGGGAMAVVNLSRTWGDAAARLVLRAPADTLFACLCDALGVAIPPYVRTAGVAVTATPVPSAGTGAAASPAAVPTCLQVMLDGVLPPPDGGLPFCTRATLRWLRGGVEGQGGEALATAETDALRGWMVSLTAPRGVGGEGGTPPLLPTVTQLEVTLHLDPTVCGQPGVAPPTAVVTQPVAAASGAAPPPPPPDPVVHTVELARVDYAATAAATVAAASAAAAAAASVTTADAPPGGRVPVAVDALDAAAYFHRLGGVGRGRCVCVLCGVAVGHSRKRAHLRVCERVAVVEDGG